MGLRAVALALLLAATCIVATSSAVSAAPSQPGSGLQAAAVLRLQAGSGTANPSAADGRSAHTPAAAGSKPGPAPAGSAGQSGSPAAAQPSSGIGEGLATSTARADGTDWLGEINYYRAAAGLTPVVDQPAWDSGIVDHLNYVAKAPKADLAGKYASLHTENPASALYTAAGAREASRSDLYFGATGLTPVSFVDGWLTAPFHAIGLLRPRLREVAFAATGGSAAGLDVIGGLDDASPGSAASAPVLFPGPGMTTPLTSYSGGESPDPLETCGWSATGANYGVPLIALLPNAPTADLRAQVVGTDGSVLSTSDGTLCVVDELTYRSTDSVYGATGLEILRDDHAVLLIARPRYGAATYTATITQAGRDTISWSFTTAP